MQFCVITVQISVIILTGEKYIDLKIIYIYILLQLLLLGVSRVKRLSYSEKNMLRAHRGYYGNVN